MGNFEAIHGTVSPSPNGAGNGGGMMVVKRQPSSYGVGADRRVSIMGNISSSNDQEIFKVLKAKLVEMERAEVDLRALQSQIDAVRAKQE